METFEAYHGCTAQQHQEAFDRLIRPGLPDDCPLRVRRSVGRALQRRLGAAGAARGRPSTVYVTPTIKDGSIRRSPQAWGPVLVSATGPARAPSSPPCSKPAFLDRGWRGTASIARASKPPTIRPCSVAWRCAR